MSEIKRYHDEDLSGAAFENCSLRSATYEYCDLSASTYSNVSFKDASFSNVNMASVTIMDTNIEGMTVLGYDILTLIRAEIARQRDQRSVTPSTDSLPMVLEPEIRYR